MVPVPGTRCHSSLGPMDGGMDSFPWGQVEIPIPTPYVGCVD